MIDLPQVVPSPTDWQGIATTIGVVGVFIVTVGGFIWSVMKDRADRRERLAAEAEAKAERLAVKEKVEAIAATVGETKATVGETKAIAEQTHEVTKKVETMTDGRLTKVMKEIGTLNRKLRTSQAATITAQQETVQHDRDRQTSRRTDRQGPPKPKPTRRRYP